MSKTGGGLRPRHPSFSLCYEGVLTRIFKLSLGSEVQGPGARSSHFLMTSRRPGERPWPRWSITCTGLQERLSTVRTFSYPQHVEQAAILVNGTYLQMIGGCDDLHKMRYSQ